MEQVITIDDSKQKILLCQLLPEIIENRGEEISSLLDQTIETNRGSFVVKEVGYVGNQIRIKLEQKSATFVLFFDARLSKQQLIAAVKDHFRIVL